MQHLGAPGYGLGLLLGAAAVGNVGATVVVGGWMSPRARERLILPLALLQLAPLVVFGVGPALFATAGLLVLSGLGSTYELGLDQRLLAALDDDNRGAVLAVGQSGLMLTQGLGFVVAGAAAELLPVTVVVTGAGALGLVVVGVLARSLRR